MKATICHQKRYVRTANGGSTKVKTHVEHRAQRDGDRGEQERREDPARTRRRAHEPPRDQRR